MALRSILNQTRFPRLWQAFQSVCGGLHDKRALCLLKYQGQPTVLEVGCSVGTIARVFACDPNVAYTGLDIDPHVIHYAQKALHATPNVSFVCQDVREFSTCGRRFGYVLFAGVCHHVETGELQSMLEAGASLLADDGLLVVVDPVLPEAGDPSFFGWFLWLEQGSFVRTSQTLQQLLVGVPGLALVSSDTHVVGASAWSTPKCARFGVYVLQRRPEYQVGRDSGKFREHDELPAGHRA
jgi:2-polyprenyl-3-methyl-5-hydroxy-6-metoxy-1,4-benzoquinol methylase